MISILFRRFFPLPLSANPHTFTFPNRCCSSAFSSMGKSDNVTELVGPSGNQDVESMNHVRGPYSSLLPWNHQPQLDSRQIKVIDSDTWHVAYLGRAPWGIEHELGSRSFDVEEMGNLAVNNPQHTVNDPDFDEIEDMRLHGNLFFKIDRDSKEFEEYAFDFHRRKPSSNNNDKRENKSKENLTSGSVTGSQRSFKGKEGQLECRDKGSLRDNCVVNEGRLFRTIKEKYIVCAPKEIDSCHDKKRRNPTFNQLTGPYHEPFCLDIYVSKGSVRACIVHRATSKVVVVAHSISKDMKFDLESTKSATAAAAVGKVLAQRALADDIHDVIFTPRKGDKIEGKLQIVLQSIMDNGVKVKVKIKQRNPNKALSKL